MDGKALIVCMSRRICVDLYNALVKLRPQWHDADDNRGAVKVVMTGSATDNWNGRTISEQGPARGAGETVQEPDDPKIVLVRDGWLTGSTRRACIRCTWTNP